MSYKVGFTGTQAGLSTRQKSEVRLVLLNAKALHILDTLEFHHGNCIGADEQAAAIAKELGFWVVAHPPIITTKMSILLYLNDEVRDPEEYLDRNHTIVDECDELIATPKQTDEVLRSGTWTTIRYAKKQIKISYAKIKKITIILPVAMSHNLGPLFN